MMTEYRAKQANDIPTPGPARGHYDEAAVRRGALELMVEQMQVHIIAQDAEIIRLNECIIELEREGLNLDAREERRFAEIADRHNWCETPRAGQVENFR